MIFAIGSGIDIFENYRCCGILLVGLLQGYYTWVLLEFDALVDAGVTYHCLGYVGNTTFEKTPRAYSSFDALSSYIALSTF